MLDLEWFYKMMF